MDSKPELGQSGGDLVLSALIDARGGSPAERLDLPTDVEALGARVEMVTDNAASDHLLELVVHHDRVALALGVGDHHLLREAARVRGYKGLLLLLLILRPCLRVVAGWRVLLY